MKRSRPPEKPPQENGKSPKTQDAELKHALYLHGADELMSGMKMFRYKAGAAAHAREQGLYIVGYDISDKFHKAFITCSKEELFHMVVRQETQYAHLTALPGGWRNIYEGLLWDRPCIPYFDLDAETCYNPQILDVLDHLTLEFMKLVTMLLRRLCPRIRAVQELRCPEDWIVLDSSNEKKASRHLLIRKEGVEFRTLEEHAKFAAHLKEEMCYKAFGAETERGLMFYVSKKEKDKPIERNPIFDSSVYSVFQLMRMFLCSKRGQERPLLIAPSFTQHASVQDCLKIHTGKPGCDPPTRRLFFDCIISNVTHSLSQDARMSLEWPAQSSHSSSSSSTQTPTSASASSSKNAGVSPNTTPTHSEGGRKTEPALSPTDWRSCALIAILKDQPLLRGWMISQTSVVDDFKISHIRNAQGKSTFIVIPVHSKFCPLKQGNHQYTGKVWVTVPSSGYVRLKCKVSECENKCDPKNKSVSLNHLSKKQICMLWPDKT